MDRAVKFKVLRCILKSFDVIENPSRGKGSHTYFEKLTPDGVIGLPIPTDKDPPLICYVKQVRRKFLLTPEHGITDSDFYGRG